MNLGGFPEQLWRSRPKRAAFVLLALLALATHVAAPPDPPLPGPEIAALHFTPVPLDASAPDRRRVGALEYLAGWEITSDTPRFGGISSMHVADGQVIALSDTGTLYRFALPSGGSGPVRIDSLADGPGPPTVKANRDSESLLVEDGRIWVGFENNNMIWRYALAGLRAETAAAPAPMADWRRNAGAEAMTRLADGRYLVFCEGLSDNRPLSDAVLFDGDPADPRSRAHLLHYRRVPGYRVSDATVLPDGRLLILNRRFEWLEGFSLAVTIADVRGLAEGMTIAPRIIARLAPPMTVDNMEAASVTVENGRPILWIASDDDFFPLQRTLLLKFALME